MSELTQKQLKRDTLHKKIDDSIFGMLKSLDIICTAIKVIKTT